MGNKYKIGKDVGALEKRLFSVEQAVNARMPCSGCNPGQLSSFQSKILDPEISDVAIEKSREMGVWGYSGSATGDSYSNGYYLGRYNYKFFGCFATDSVDLAQLSSAALAEVEWVVRRTGIVPVGFVSATLSAIQKRGCQSQHASGGPWSTCLP